MRALIKEFVSLITQSLPIKEPIYEFGSLQVPGQEGFADLRPLFPDRQYIGCDIEGGPGVDRILDLHSSALPSESVGTVLCIDTLEHVEYPHLALREVGRILYPGGIAVISSVMNHHIHNYPFDYWRLTPEGFKSLLKPFPSSFVGYGGDKHFPHTVVGIGFKGVQPNVEPFIRMYEDWQNREPRQRQNLIKSPMKANLKRFIPPILIRIGRMLI
jgi:SAM-dependent methyltransferase